jgi:hypothetical protein
VSSLLLMAAQQGEEGPVTTIDEDSPIFGWLWSDEHAHQLESLMVETMV